MIFAEDFDEQSDASNDNEFHDAEDSVVSNDKVIEEIFADAISLDDSKDFEVVDAVGGPAEPKVEMTEEEVLENKEKSERLKKAGNEIFKTGDYEKALEIYTEALETCPAKCPHERAVLYNNRAAAHKHLDAKNAAIEDCTHAIELNESYVKAYMR